jgi:hypothetical protein
MGKILGGTWFTGRLLCSEDSKGCRCAALLRILRKTVWSLRICPRLVRNLEAGVLEYFSDAEKLRVVFRGEHLSTIVCLRPSALLHLGILNFGIMQGRRAQPSCMDFAPFVEIATRPLFRSRFANDDRAAAKMIANNNYNRIYAAGKEQSKMLMAGYYRQHVPPSPRRRLPSQNVTQRFRRFRSVASSEPIRLRSALSSSASRGPDGF